MCIGVGYLKELPDKCRDVSKVCSWEFRVNFLAGSLLKNSVFHSGVAGGLAIIEGILLDLDASRGRGSGVAMGSLVCEV